MTRFLADENVPGASILLLRQHGLDIRSIGEDAPGTPDARVLEEAHDDGRVLLTFDRDFGELIYRRGLQAPPAVVYLRFVPATPEEPATIIRNLLEHGEIQIRVRPTVVTREGVRQRPLPRRLCAESVAEPGYPARGPGERPVGVEAEPDPAGGEARSAAGAGNRARSRRLANRMTSS